MNYFFRLISLYFLGMFHIVHDEPIKLGLLEKDKTFVKILRKHQKEQDSLQRKQCKELLSVQKAQCLAVEKLTKGKR